MPKKINKLDEHKPEWMNLLGFPLIPSENAENMDLDFTNTWFVQLKHNKPRMQSSSVLVSLNVSHISYTHQQLKTHHLRK